MFHSTDHKKLTAMTGLTSANKKMSLTMKEWLENELYFELTQMPLWTLSAFGTLQEGEIISKHDTRFRLIAYLVNQKMDKVPSQIFSQTFKDSWSPSEFKECVKKAVEKCKTYNF